MDAVSAYFDTPGGEQQIAHPGTGGDACTAIELTQDLAGVLADGDPARISEPRLTPVDAALAVQLLTPRAGRAARFGVTRAGLAPVLAADHRARRPPRHAAAPPPPGGRAPPRLRHETDPQLRSGSQPAPARAPAVRRTASPEPRLPRLHRHDRVRLPQPASGARSTRAARRG